MIQAAADSPQTCITRYYTKAWAIGTGLRISLPPGQYVVTGEELFEGSVYLQLNDRYRVEARDVGNIPEKHGGRMEAESHI